MMKTPEEIKKGLEDSIAYFKQRFPDDKYPENGELNAIRTRTMEEFKEDMARFAIASEICTLRWVIEDGILNCYGDHAKNYQTMLIECMGCHEQITVLIKDWDEGKAFHCTNCDKDRFTKRIK